MPFCFGLRARDFEMQKQHEADIINVRLCRVCVCRAVEVFDLIVEQFLNILSLTALSFNGSERSGSTTSTYHSKGLIDSWGDVGR